MSPADYAIIIGMACLCDTAFELFESVMSSEKLQKATDYLFSWLI